MATLQPIIDAIKNAIDWLTSAIVDGVSWVMKKIPGVIKSAGGWAKSIIDFIANIVDGITWLPRQFAKMWESVVPMLLEGIRTITIPLQKLFNAVGLESWGNKLNSVLTSLSDSAKTFGSNIESGMLAAGQAVRNLGTSIQNTLSNLGSAMEYSANLRERELQLTKDQRDANVELAESENKVASARREYNEAMASGDTVRAAEALNKIEKEANEQARIRTDIEQRKLNIMNEYAALTANSAQDNEAISKQQVALINVQTRAQQDLANAARMRARLEREITKQGRAASKETRDALKQARKAEQAAMRQRQKELADAIKAEQKLTKEQQQHSKESVQQTEDIIKQYEKDYSEFDKYERLKLDLAKQLNVLTKKQQVDYENARYKGEQDLNERILQEYKKLLDDETVLENDKNKIRAKIHDLTLKTMTNSIQHDVNLAKIDAENLNELVKRLDTQLKTMTSEALTESQRMMNEELIALNEQYSKNEISNREYLKRLENIREEHQNRLNKIELDGAQQRAQNSKTIFDNYIQNIQDRYKNILTIISNAETELDRVIDEEYETESPDTNRIDAARQTYNTLLSIYESGENGITNILSTLLEVRSNILKDGESSLSQEMQTYISELSLAFAIDESDIRSNVDSMLKHLSEILHINLDEMLQMWQNYITNRNDVISTSNEQQVKLNTDAAKDAIKGQENQLKAMQKVTQQMARTMSAVSDYWQNSIEMRLEAGEISKEQAEAEFERLKQFNIAQAVVDTIAGSLSAYMSVWKESSLPLWSKIAMSVLLGAQTLASGYTQIRQIQAQTLSGAGASVTGSGTNVIVSNATPLLNEQQDINRLDEIAYSNMAANEQQDIRVYVVESDITEAQNRHKVKVNESTF